jgi:adhesin/invasin
VLLGNQPLPILYTSTGQLNVQVPYTVPVNTQYQLTVQHGNTLSVPQSLVVAQAQPGIFTVNQQGTGQGSIVKSDQVTLAQPGTPAAVGETIVIYCTGLGAVTPAVAAGSRAPLATTANTVSVTIGGKAAQVAFAGLTPGYAGLYQVNAVVPSGITTGNAVPVVLSVAGQTGPPVTMAVK